MEKIQKANNMKIDSGMAFEAISDRLYRAENALSYSKDGLRPDLNLEKNRDKREVIKPAWN